jgi:hypothetical protein
MKRRDLGLSANCPANYVGLRRGHRQGRGAPDSWKILRARVRICRSAFLGQAKNSLWSSDLFRGESLTLRTHGVLVVMDQFPSRIIGLGIHRGTVDGPSLCSMFQRALHGQVYEVSQHGQRIRCIGSSNGRPMSVGGDGNQDRTLGAARASLC